MLIIIFFNHKLKQKQIKKQWQVSQRMIPAIVQTADIDSEDH
jgi:hypothetical protein